MSAPAMELLTVPCLAANLLAVTTPSTATLVGLATLLGAVGLWLLLPRGGGRGGWLGALLGLASLGLLVSQLPSVQAPASAAVFYVLAAVTVISAVATITFRSPVYCAIWFALSLLGTAALFLFQGSQFLGVATVVVYAGAILVTFLFVLMLAQPQGDAFYDRISWEGLLSAMTGAVLVGMLTLTLSGVFAAPEEAARPAVLFTPEQLEANVLTTNHMAALGAQLFSRYLIEVEVAGTLLLVALVGAVAIVSQSVPRAVGQGESAPLRLDPRSVAPRGSPEDEARRIAAEKSHQHPSGQEVLRG